MTFKKSILVSACTLAFTGMTGLALAKPASVSMRDDVVPDTRTMRPVVEPAAPVRVLPTPAVADDNSAREIHSDYPEATFNQIFSTLPAAVAPTGILLERDAPFSQETIVRLNGSATAPAITSEEFDLIAEELGTAAGLVNGADLIQQRHHYNNEQGVIPISMLLMNYDTLGEDPSTKLTLTDDNRLTLKKSIVDTAETKLVFAVSLDKSRLSFKHQKFIMPSSLFFSNVYVASDVTRMAISFGGEKPQTFRFDQAFDMTSKFANAESITARVTVHIGNQQLVAASKKTYDRPTSAQINALKTPSAWVPRELARSQARSRSGLIFQDAACEILCYRLWRATQKVDFVTPDGDDSTAKGVVIPMVYPTRALNDQSKLRNTIILVDGFDNQLDRDHAYLYEDYAEDIATYQELGYDVIVLDYQDGTNWIQNNAFALREFLVNNLHFYVADEYLDKTVIVGRSMGSLVVRYALRTAELAGEDHHIALMVSHDGPNYGSSVPAGFSHMLKWADKWKIASLLKADVRAAKRPAAPQMLRKEVNRQNELEIPKEFLEWYGELNGPELGFPQDSRNLALANGSGTGSLQTGSERWTDLGETNPTFRLLRVNNPLALLDPMLIPARITIDTNHDGQVFSATKLLSLRRLFLLPYTTRRYTRGNEVNYIDIAPGGNIDKFSVGVLGFVDRLDAAAHVTTNSSLMYKGRDDIFEVPSFDDNVLDHTPFTEVFFDQCNSLHTEFTDNIEGVLSQEMIALRDGIAPPAIQRPQERCGDKEPENLCFLPARLNDAQGNSKLSVVRHDGEYCQVAPVPAGRTGFVQGKGLYLEPVTKCPTGSFVTATGCGFARLPADHLYAYTDKTDLIMIAQPTATISCPDNTRFKSRTGMVLLCELQMPNGYDGHDLRLDQAGNFEYKIDLEELCPGGRKFQGIQGAKVCVVGSIPENTQGLIHDGHFVYDEFTQ